MSANAIESQILETEPEDFSRGLTGIPLSPPLTADPESQLGLKVLGVDVTKAGAADELRFGKEADGEVGGPAPHRLPPLMADPGERVVEIVGVRNGYGGVGDLPGPGHAL